MLPRFRSGLDLGLITLDRMAGPILQTDTRVAWASRTNSPTFTRGERAHLTPSGSSPDPPSSRVIFPLSEHRFADSSPSPFTTLSPAHGRNLHNRFQPPTSDGDIPSPTSGPGCAVDVGEMHVPGENSEGDGLQTPNRETVSAPAELHQLHRKITIDTPETKVSADMLPSRREQPSKIRTHSVPVPMPTSPFQSTSSTKKAISELRQKDAQEFHLDRTAPIRALRHPPASASTGAGGQVGSIMGTIEEQRGQSGTPESMLDTVKKCTSPMVNDVDRRAPSGQAEGTTDKQIDELQTWGEPFRLQWVKTERLPFYRTRHLRNPWNHDREVKVSRDGTELEPSVGQALLDEWERVTEAPSTEKTSQQPAQGGGSGRQQGRGKGGGVGGGHRGKR